MTDNKDPMRHWARFDDIDPMFTKPITGKAYKGTSPNPQYVIKCLTEIFGPVGEGFGWSVIAEDFQPIGDEVLHWCRIEFWHTDRANTFEGYGQTKALASTRNGLKSDEDAPKKSLTDAIVKASSHIGIAANIFLGRWDDSKYVAEVNAEFRKDDPVKEQPAENKPTPTKITEFKGNMIQSLTANATNILAVEANAKYKADLKWLRDADPAAADDVEAHVKELKARLQ